MRDGDRLDDRQRAGTLYAVPGAVDSVAVAEAVVKRQDGKLIPGQITFENYKAIFQATSSARLWSTRSDRADHHGDRGGRRRDGRVRDRPAGVPRQEGAVGVALLIAMFRRSRW
jgi:hypothetical protein